MQVGAGTDDWSLADGIFGQNAEEVSEDRGLRRGGPGQLRVPLGEDQLLHVGGSTRYRELDNDSNDGAVQYRQRPFFHFTNIYSVDTGEVDDADSDLFFGGETALVRGALSLQAEAAHTWLNRAAPTMSTGSGAGTLAPAIS